MAARLKQRRVARLPKRLQTARLIMRVPDATHAPRLAAVVQASYPELHRWLGWARGNFGSQEALSYCRRAARRHASFSGYDLLLFHKWDSQLIGGAWLVTPIDWQHRRFEIGYWLDTSRVGRGYASEAVRALVRLVFECFGAKRVELGIDVLNKSSCAVAERLGFALATTVEDHSRNNAGEPRDVHIYCLVDLSALR